MGVLDRGTSLLEMENDPMSDWVRSSWGVWPLSPGRDLMQDWLRVSDR